MNDLDRFIACHEYEPGAPRPNHELGVWPQTVAEWQEQNPRAVKDFSWNWFWDEDELALDHRNYICVNYDFIPLFDYEVLEEDERYIVARNGKGIVSRALKEGTVGGGRMCMDEYIGFPVKEPKDFAEIKKRLIAGIPERYPENLDDLIENQYKSRTCPLVLGTNCAIRGFYWCAREWMGTEALSYAWFDHPELIHEMMEFFADFVIETSRPVLEKIQVEYVCFNEDYAMKSGPLLGPSTYETFIQPHLERICSFLRDHGTKYIAVDSDGNPEALIPLMMDAGVDIAWPLERASHVDPLAWRKKFGRDLRLWGGVDKRILVLGPEAIKEHLRTFIPLIEEGGFIPTVDHTVQPGVSWDNFRCYMDLKRELLNGNFAALD